MTSNHASCSEQLPLQTNCCFSIPCADVLSCVFLNLNGLSPSSAEISSGIPANIHRVTQTHPQGYAEPSTALPCNGLGLTIDCYNTPPRRRSAPNKKRRSSCQTIVICGAGQSQNAKSPAMAGRARFQARILTSKVLGVLTFVFLPFFRQVVGSKNRGNRTHRHAGAAVDTFDRIDEQHLGV
jgi:hypothetical protein